MKTVTFKQFKVDYEEFYKDKLTTIRTKSEIDEVIYCLYDSDEFHYEIDYENKQIELY